MLLEHIFTLLDSREIWNVDPTNLNCFHCFSGRSQWLDAFCIRDDRNNLTLLWGLASGKRRSCFFAFLNAKQGSRGAGHSAVRTPCSLYVSKLSSLIAHSLPRKLRAGGHKVARHLPSKVLFLSFGVSWYLRKHNLCQESNVYQGLQAMTHLGWIEATSSWSLHSNPEEKILFWKILLDYWFSF